MLCVEDDGVPGEQLQPEHLPAQVRGHLAPHDGLLQADVGVEGVGGEADIPQPPHLHPHLLHAAAPLPIRLHPGLELATKLRESLHNIQYKQLFHTLELNTMKREVWLTAVRRTPSSGRHSS